MTPRTARRSRWVSLGAAWAIAMAVLAGSPGEAVADGAPPAPPAPQSAGGQTFDDEGSDLAATDTALLSSWARAGLPTNEFVVAERPAGGSWQAPQVLSEPGSNVQGGTKLQALADGTVLALWQADPDETGENSIFGRVRSPGGTWGSPLTISNAAADLRDMHVVGVGNRALLAWFEVAAGSGVVYAASWSPTGGWTAPEQVSETGEDSGFPSPALAADGSAVIAFENYSYPYPGASVISVSRRSGIGGFENPEPLSGLTRQSYDAQSAIDGSGNATVIWSRESEPDEIRFAVAGSGGAWTPPASFPSGHQGEGIYGPRLVVAGAEVLATWVTPGVPADETTLWSSVLAAGQGWAAPVALSVGVTAPAAVVADPRGNVTATWSAGGQTVVAHRKVDGDWGSPGPVPGPASDRKPAIAADPHGRIAVGMTDDDGEVMVSGPYVEVPTAQVTGPTSPFTSSSTPRFSWTSASTWTEVVSTSAEYRRTGWNKTKPSAWQPIGGAYGPQDSVRLKAASGYTYCTRIRSTDDLGNAGASAERCITTPLDDRKLKGKGWKHSKAKGNYRKTLTSTTMRGRVLSARGAKASSIALLVRRSPNAGKVAVFQGKKRLKVVSLKGKRAGQVIVLIRTSSKVRKGTIKIKVLTQGKPVQIDGLLVGK